MSDSINCNFARCAVRHYMNQRMKETKFPKGVMPEIVRDYNHTFADIQPLQVTYKVATHRFEAIRRLFNLKWHPQEEKSEFISAFNLEAWRALSKEDKEAHTLKECNACAERFTDLNNSFPSASRKRKVIKAVPKLVTIKLSEEDLHSPQDLGQKVLMELDNISQDWFQKSGEDIIVETPQSQLIHKITPEEKRKAKLKIERNMRDAITRTKNEEATGLVLENRISWNTYNRLRKAEGLVTPQKRPPESGTDGEPCRKKRYGDLSATLQINKLKLLQEAQTWKPDQQINWSQLARKYGIMVSNGGQIIKEYLHQNDISAAKVSQRPSRIMRRCKKRISSCNNIAMPMFPTVMHEKAKLQECIAKGKHAQSAAPAVSSITFHVGHSVPTSYNYFSVDSETNVLHANTVNISARKIPLKDIREKLL